MILAIVGIVLGAVFLDRALRLRVRIGLSRRPDDRGECDSYRLDPVQSDEADLDQPASIHAKG